MQAILFLGGAPKSGTSYLFDLLAQHPNICPSQPKETFYFVDTNYPLARPKYNFFQDGIVGFQPYFQATKNTNWLLEGSTHLLYQKDCIKAISDLDAQVLFVLREPASRIQSAFEYTKNRAAILREEVSFEQYTRALLAKDNKTIDAWVRRDVAYHFLKEELLFSTYNMYLKPWIDTLGKERMQVLQFESLKQKPDTIAQSIFQQIGLLGHELNTQIAQHTTYQIQNKGLHYYVRQLNKIVPKNQLRDHLRDWYFRIQKRPLPAPQSDISLATLKNYFQPYNQELAELVDIDLSLWR